MMMVMMALMMTLAFSDIALLPTTPVEEKVAEYNDSLFYIYTSGTTGEQNDDDGDDGVDDAYAQVCRKQRLSLTPVTCLPPIVSFAWGLLSSKMSFTQVGEKFYGDGDSCVQMMVIMNAHGICP